MFKKLLVDPKIRARHRDLVDSPVIVVVTNFEDDGVRNFRKGIEKAHHTGQPLIPVLIDSYGGNVYGCLDMVEHINKSKLPIHTVITGKAMSAGAILFGMGETRWMCENATLMLHDASTWTAGKTGEIKSDAKELERLNKLIFKLLANKCGQKDDYFEKIIHEKGHADWFLTAKEAKKHKICTHIGMPELTVKVSVDYDFS